MRMFFRYCVAFLFVMPAMLTVSSLAYSDSVTEVVVKGRQYEKAMSNGDYYNIGRLQYEMRREQGMLDNTSNEGSSGADESTSEDGSGTRESNSNSEVDSCDTIELVRIRCEATARRAYREQLAMCRTPSIWGRGEQCRAELKAELEEDLVECEFKAEYDTQLCETGRTP